MQLERAVRQSHMVRADAGLLGSLPESASDEHAKQRAKTIFEDVNRIYDTAIKLHVHTGLGHDKPRSGRISQDVSSTSFPKGLPEARQRVRQTYTDVQKHGVPRIRAFIDAVDAFHDTIEQYGGWTEEAALTSPTTDDWFYDAQEALGKNATYFNEDTYTTTYE